MNGRFSFSKEKFKHVMYEMKPLLQKHYQEIAHFHDIALDPDFDLYCKIEELGNLQVFCVRDVCTDLVGYAIYFTKHNLHYKASFQAAQDVIFLEDQYRKTGIGSDFVDYCDGQLKELGCQLTAHHIKTKHNWGQMLEKKGYELVDLIYVKRLDV